MGSTGVSAGAVSTTPQLTRDFIINNGGSFTQNGHTIEIGRGFNNKTNDYSGPFIKSTIVSGPKVKDDGGIKTFRNTEKAIEFFNKLIKK